MTFPGVPDRMTGGSILMGESTADLDQYALFDRIINVRFRHRSGSIFTIRSDYEVAFLENGQPYFIPIRQKPCITVSYKQVSQGTSIEVFIEVTNLFFDIDSGSPNFLTNQGDPVVQAEIWMGYRKQFPDWTKRPLAGDTDETAHSSHPLNRLKLFYEMGMFQETNTLQAMDTGLCISVQILAIMNKSLPPDRVTVFQGVVGRMEHGLRWTRGGDLLEYLNNDNNFQPKTDYATRLFWLYMTSRFPKMGVHYTYQMRDIFHEEDGKPPRLIGSKAVSMSVFDYNAETGLFFQQAEQINKSTADRWLEGTFDLEYRGIMPLQHAVALGVRCYLTRRIIDSFEEGKIPRGSAAAATDGSVSTERAHPLLEFQQHEGAQMIALQQLFPFIRWQRAMDGSFMVYHEKDKMSAIVEAEQRYNVRSQRNILLPAIYDISVSGIRTIRCPFISFLSPGQRVGFRAKYQISDIVGHFYPLGEDAWFNVVISEVTFSTVDDNNMMVLTCTDAPPVEEDPEPWISPAERIPAKTVVRWRRLKNGIGDWSATLRGLEAAAGTRRITTWFQMGEYGVIDNQDLQKVTERPEGMPSDTHDGEGNLWSEVLRGKRNPSLYKYVAALNWWLDTPVNDDRKTNRDISKELYAAGRRRLPTAEAQDGDDAVLGSLGLKDPQHLVELRANEDVWYFPVVVIEGEEE